MILEDQVKADTITVDMFIAKINKSKDMINKVANLKIKNFKNYLIDKVANLTTNDVRNNLIEKVANLTIINVGNDSNIATESDVQVQFEGSSTRITHQILLNRWIIGIRPEEVPVLVHPTEPIITTNN